MQREMMFGDKRATRHWRNVVRYCLIFLTHGEAEGRTLVRCLAADEDPEGTEHV